MNSIVSDDIVRDIAEIRCGSINVNAMASRLRDIRILHCDIRTRNVDIMGRIAVNSQVLKQNVMIYAAVSARIDSDAAMVQR